MLGHHYHNEEDLPHLPAYTGEIICYITIGGSGRFPAEIKLDLILWESNGWYGHIQNWRRRWRESWNAAVFTHKIRLSVLSWFPVDGHLQEKTLTQFIANEHSFIAYGESVGVIWYFGAEIGPGVSIFCLIDLLVYNTRLKGWLYISLV